MKLYDALYNSLSRKFQTQFQIPHRVRSFGDSGSCYFEIVKETFRVFSIFIVA